MLNLFSDNWNWLKEELSSQDFFKSKNNRIELGEQVKVVSFFCGCGGFDLGFKWAGFNIVYANEVDQNAAKTCSSNVNEHVTVAPIETIDISSIPNHDILIGGFPCQPFSHAGKQLGLEDTRGTLFYYLAKCLKIKKPKYFLFENVKGLLTHDKGRTLNTILMILNRCGYNISYTVLNAKHYNVPQNRERIFIMGIRNDIEKSFCFPPEFDFNMTVEEAIDDLLGQENVPNNEPMKHTKRIVERYRYIPQGGSLKDVPKEHMQRKRGDSSKISGKTSTQSYKRLISTQPSPTLCAMFQAHFVHYSQDRNLTAREAARIQSFPDDFVFRGKRVTMSWEKGLSQYEQIGNAVPPKLAFALARTIYKSLFME